MIRKMIKHQSRSVSQIVKLSNNFMHCGEKFCHSWQTVGKKPPFLPKKCLQIFNILCQSTTWVNYCRLQCLRINATFVENKCNFVTFSLLINATFVENKCNLLTYLLQQKLALTISMPLWLQACIQNWYLVMEKEVISCNCRNT